MENIELSSNLLDLIKSGPQLYQINNQNRYGREVENQSK